MRCHTIKDRGVSIHIPGCEGCAAFGHHRCTCREGNRIDRWTAIEARLEKLEKAFKKLVERRKQ